MPHGLRDRPHPRCKALAGDQKPCMPGNSSSASPAAVRSACPGFFEEGSHSRRSWLDNLERLSSPSSSAMPPSPAQARESTVLQTECVWRTGPPRVARQSDMKKTPSRVLTVGSPTTSSFVDSTIWASSRPLLAPLTGSRAAADAADDGAEFPSCRDPPRNEAPADRDDLEERLRSLHLTACREVLTGRRVAGRKQVLFRGLPWNHD